MSAIDWLQYVGARIQQLLHEAQHSSVQPSLPQLGPGFVLLLCESIACCVRMMLKMLNGFQSLSCHPLPLITS